MTRTNRNTALATALVEELARSGLAYACVAPGSRSAPLALAFWNHPKLRVFTHVDERCAGFFALGLAQQTGRPAAVLTTSGTAAANLYPAVIEASEARVPLIVITADRPPELRGIGAGQTIDQLKLFGGYVRWFCELGVHAAGDSGLIHFRATGSRAYAEALADPAGPVHLNVPLSEPLAPVERPDDVTATDRLALAGRGDAPLTRVRASKRTPTRGTITELTEAIAGKPRGLIVAGRQRNPRLAANLTAFAEAAGYPVLAEATSQLRCGAHALDRVIAHYDAILREPPEELAPQVVVRVGDMPTSKALRQWLARVRPAQIVIDAEGAWNEPTRVADLIVRTDPSATFGKLAEAIANSEHAYLDSWREAEGIARKVIEAFFDKLGDELFEPKVYAEAARHLPQGATVFIGSSMPIREFETFFPALANPLRFLSNRGANGIDGVISSGLGAAAAELHRTYVIAGDLSLYHDMNGLLAATREKLDVTILVPNNGGGGIFSFLPIAEFRDGWEELFGTPTGLDLSRVAALYELPYTRLDAYADLDDALAGPGIVEIPLDRERNVGLHRELFSKVATALVQGER